MEWIMYIITCLSPEHLAKSLKRCSNHNIQSSCCCSSSLRILNVHRVNFRLHRSSSERTNNSRWLFGWLMCVLLILNMIFFFFWNGNFYDFLSCGREKKIKLKVILAGSDELWGRFTLVLLRDENNGARRGRLFLLSNNAVSKV